MSVASLTHTARVEQLRQGDHEYDRGWTPVAAIAMDPRTQANTRLSEWLDERQPETGTYRLVTSWGARSDEVAYRKPAA